MENQIIFLVASIVGMVLHYMKQYATGATSVPIYKWFGSSNVNASILTIITFLFAVVGALAMGVVTPAMGVWVVIYTGLTTGFTIDAGVNSDAKHPATDNQLIDDARDADLAGERARDQSTLVIGQIKPPAD